MSAQQIRNRIEQILQYMDESRYWDFVNCHMVNYLTHNHWQRFVPENIKAELNSCANVECAIEELFWQQETKLNDNKRFPNLSEFLSTSQKHRLDAFSDIVVNTKDFYKNYNVKTLDSSITVKEFLTDKKVHEVETMAELTNNLIQICGKENQKNFIVVDIGDGKGYLSSRLALQYYYQVVGIDQNENNTKNALERSRKLNRVWPALVERAQRKSPSAVKDTPQSACNCESPKQLKTPQNTSLKTYTTIPKYVTADLDIASILYEHFSDTYEKSFGIVGLHTCGNLASTCVRLFKQKQCAFLCNVGCCYHLLTESFYNRNTMDSTFTTSTQEDGFPMSEYLRKKEIKLGRNARMLAAQSIERTLNAKELPNISLFYRALLELLIISPDEAESVKIGKIKKFTNFEDYVQRSKMLNKINIDPNDLTDFEQHHKQEKCYLDMFYLLRMNFAPILESLILLDRLLYLKELGYEKSYLVSLFDPVVSPRRFAIVSFKESYCIESLRS